MGKHLVYRLYREEGLTLRHRPPRRRKAVGVRAHRPLVTSLHEAWTLDCVADQLANGHRFRALTVVDVCTRESLAIEIGQHLRSDHVVQVLTRLTAQRGAPKRLFCDHGSEFCSRLVDLWAYHHHVQIDFSRPGKPTDNAMWNPSMPRYDGHASMHTGSSPCPRLKHALKPGGGSTMRVALTGRSRIKRQPGLWRTG